MSYINENEITRTESIKIELPKVEESNRFKNKVKKYCEAIDLEGNLCGKEYSTFMQHTKYCSLHRSVKNRIYTRNLKRYSGVLLFNHSFKEKTNVKFYCAHCGGEFEVDVYPGVKVRPEYCEKHRSLFKREFDLRMKKGKA